MSKSLLNIKSLSITLFLLAFLPNWAAANPVLNQVVAGEVNVSQTQTTTTVVQKSDRGVVDWHNFDIAANESVHFDQKAGGVTLNRIDPSKMTQIFGNLSATGKIILVNGAGIHFAPGSMVNVGGIVASAASGVSVQNFMNGKWAFDQASAVGNGQVINQGTIKAADHGLVALVGNSVINDGTIVATLGEVYLASADKFTIGLTNGGMADGLINFSIDAPATQKEAGVTVTDKGSIIADGGLVFLTARSVSKLLDNAINMDGVIQANTFGDNTFGDQPGVVILGEDLHRNDVPTPELKGPAIKIKGKISTQGEAVGTSGGGIVLIGQGPIDLSGELSAKGDRNGGFVVLASREAVDLKNGATIDVSGGENGGLIALFSEKDLKASSGSKLKADSLKQGHGGAMLISGKDTNIEGELSARGGVEGGDGGAILVAGETSVNIDAEVDLSAPKGQEGTMDVILDNDDEEEEYKD